MRTGLRQGGEYGWRGLKLSQGVDGNEGVRSTIGEGV